MQAPDTGVLRVASASTHQCWVHPLRALALSAVVESEVYRQLQTPKMSDVRVVMLVSFQRCPDPTHVTPARLAGIKTNESRLRAKHVLWAIFSQVKGQPIIAASVLLGGSPPEKENLSFSTQSAPAVH